MADTLTQLSTNDNLLPEYFVPEALLTLYNETHLYEFAKKAPQPKRRGDTTFWNAWVRLAGASSTLAEGGNNSTTALSSRRVSATPAQYGRGVKISDLEEFMTVLDAREGALKQLKESAKETFEYVCQTGIFKTVYFTQNNSKTLLLSSVMSSLASSFCANTGTSSRTNRQFQFPAVFSTSCARLSAVNATAPSQSAQLSLYGVRKALNRLERLNAQRLADGYFVGYTHPNAVHSLRRDKNWENWHQYTGEGQSAQYRGEIGRMTTWGVRFITSSICPRYAVAAHSVLPVFIFGNEAFGVTEALGGLEMFMTSGVDSGNPYATFQYITYKITAAAAALNPSAGVILWCHESLA
jgi:N4-gp56 family major capsid protein